MAAPVRMKNSEVRKQLALFFSMAYDDRGINRVAGAIRWVRRKRNGAGNAPRNLVEIALPSAKVPSLASVPPNKTPRTPQKHRVRPQFVIRRAVICITASVETRGAIGEQIEDGK
jgi:hypothetical protein